MSLQSVCCEFALMDQVLQQRTLTFLKQRSKSLNAADSNETPTNHVTVGKYIKFCVMLLYFMNLGATTSEVRNLTLRRQLL